MLIFVPELVIRYTSAVYYMFSLFGNVRLMGLQVEFVTTTTCLVRGVIFEIDAARVVGAVVCAQTEGIHIQLTKFREAVAVVVVSITVAIALIDSNAV